MHSRQIIPKDRRVYVRGDPFIQLVVVLYHPPSDRCPGVLSLHTSRASNCTPGASDQRPMPSLAALRGCTHAAMAVLSTTGRAVVLGSGLDALAMSSTTA